MAQPSFKVFGETQEDRDRVLVFLQGDQPEVNMAYCEEEDKLWVNHSPSSEGLIQLAGPHIARSQRFLNVFLSKEQ